MLEALPSGGLFEGYVPVEPGPLFAAVAGGLKNGDEALSADLKPSEEARRAYLYARRFFNFDPMLVLRRGPGKLDLRVYPLRRGVTATAAIEGYLLVDREPSSEPRLYRTKERYLAVVPLATDERREEAAFRDERRGRSLHFLSEAECRARFGSRVAEEVPFVHALECAATGRGSGAACADTALVAIATDSPQPPFVGPDRVESVPGRVPPGLREPSDPEPPPPPTEDAPPPAAAAPVTAAAPPPPVAAAPRPRFQR
jgi:hypothetical protein